MPRKKVSRHLKIKIPQKKKFFSFIVSFVLFLFGSFSSSVFALGMGSDWKEHFAQYIGDDTVLCVVESSEKSDKYRAFLSHADDMAGREIKEQTDTYLFCKKDSDYLPAEMIYGETKISVNSVLLYTTWQFDVYNFGLLTFTNQPIRELSYDEIYIDYNYANQISISTGIDIQSLVGMETDFIFQEKTKKIKIVDIVTNLNALNMGPDLKDGVIISSYHQMASYFTNLSYRFVMRGEALAKTYTMYYLEYGINETSGNGKTYTSTYYKLHDNNIIESDFQSVKENLHSLFSSSKNRFLILFAIGPLLIIFAMIFCELFQIIGREILVSLYSSSLLYILILWIFKPYLVISAAPFFLASRIGSAMIISFLLLTSVIYFLFETTDVSSKRIAKEKSK